MCITIWVLGELDYKYGQNPYYVSIDNFVKDNREIVTNDKIISASLDSCSYQTVVYGPIWPLVCKILVFFSMGNLDLGLALFKLFNIIFHLLNCYFIYKLTKSKKMTLLYGLNPFILLEGLSNVHNDMCVITLIFLSLYLLLKKRNICLSVVILAISTAIKYYAVMLLPFFIIYYFRKETIKVRIKKLITYSLLFVGIIGIAYLIYFNNFNVITGMITQQNKMAKSLFLLIYLSKIFDVYVLKKVLLLIFAIIYGIICIRLLTSTKIKFIDIMRKYNILLFIFIFILITNFQPWYIMWLFPTFMWQKTSVIKDIIYVSILSQIANLVFMLYNESYIYGMFFSIILLSGLTIILIYNHRKEIKWKS